MTNPAIDLWRGVAAAFRDKRVQGLLAFTFTLIGLATIFFAWIENWGYVDALYFSVMTIATVGYGDLAPVTPLGRLVTVAYVIIGLGIFVAAVTAIADTVIAQHNKDLSE
jgi:voltage-gated potassium channel